MCCRQMILTRPPVVFRQKSEEDLNAAEAELDKHTSLVTDLTRKVRPFIIYAVVNFISFVCYRSTSFKSRLIRRRD